ncbi:MAG: glycosyltransferase, partial [Candidatus Eremiobacteraeota bacterium]|nr:glycosyltransferase [Candidatus Eremiobacteraeota bacterium]
PDGRGRAQTYDWPASVVELTEADARHVRIDAVVYQRAQELGSLGERWLQGRRPGSDFAAYYVEHNAPIGHPNEMRHVVADRDDITLVHVTHFNALFWDAGRTRVAVIEHGIVDPGYRYRGTLERSAVVINEAARRRRVTGTDLLATFALAAPIDLYGIDAERLGGVGDLPQERLHDAMAERRVYIHPFRWTSLGLALIEAMSLGMPVIALATTDVPSAVAAGTGICSNDLTELLDGIRAFIADPKAAREAGEAARDFATRRFGLERFVQAWEELFKESMA